MRQIRAALKTIILTFYRSTWPSRDLVHNRGALLHKTFVLKRQKEN